MDSGSRITGGGSGYAALLAHAEGALYGTELGSVTLKRIGFFCFPIKHSTHTPNDPPARLRFNLKWGHRAGFPALHSGTAQSNASLSSLSTPTNLTVATTEVSAAACYYVRGGGEEKESATDKTSCSRARAVRASGCSAYIWWQRQEHPLVSLDALVSATFLFDSSLFNTQHISMCS